jgi:hypothetical protein
MSISYCLPPASTGGLKVTVLDLDERQPVWSTRVAWEDASWHEDIFPLWLGEGEYLIMFDAESTWSNPDQLDPAFSPENRSLGFALSKLSFDAAETDGAR